MVIQKLSVSMSLTTGSSSIESDGSEVRMMEGFTRSLPSSPLLNLRLAKRTRRSLWQSDDKQFGTLTYCIHTAICHKSNKDTHSYSTNKTTDHTEGETD